MKKKNKLYLHLHPTIERIMFCFAAALFTFLSLSFLIVDVEASELYRYIIMLVISIIVDFGVFFSVFKNYICIDLEKQILIYRPFPGWKKTETPLLYVEKLAYCDPDKLRAYFTIDIHYKSGVVEKLDMKDYARSLFYLRSSAKRKIERILSSWNERIASN